jgi:hypothetical protein
MHKERGEKECIQLSVSVGTGYGDQGRKDLSKRRNSEQTECQNEEGWSKRPEPTSKKNNISVNVTNGLGQVYACTLPKGKQLWGATV